MTNIDFYILAEQTFEGRLMFACRLIERAWLKGNPVFVQLNGPEEAKALDEMLWRFSNHTFIPHGLLGESDDAPVVLGWEQDCLDQHQVLINLADEIPTFFSRFERMCEVVIQDDTVLECTRKHYKFLRERGYPLKNIDMRDR